MALLIFFSTMYWCKHSILPVSFVITVINILQYEKHVSLVTFICDPKEGGQQTIMFQTGEPPIHGEEQLVQAVHPTTWQ